MIFTFFFSDREVPYSLPLCSTTAKWCTKSIEEKEKCDVIHTAGVTTGILLNGFSFLLLGKDFVHSFSFMSHSLFLSSM